LSVEVVAQRLKCPEGTVFAGPGSVFEGAPGVSASEIRDGISETVAIVEAAKPVLWTKPEDLPYAPGEPLSHGRAVPF
jgi:hypothetical protein